MSDTLSYGFVAINRQADKTQCGRCYQIQFEDARLRGKSMIVQVIQGAPFNLYGLTLALPGGGVGYPTACPQQWARSDLGPEYGGFWLACNGDKACIRAKCDTVFAGKPKLQASCDWFVDWLGGVDRPLMGYAPIECPAALTKRSGMPSP